MAVVVFTLLLVVQLPRIFASRLLIESEACGTDHISHLGYSGHELFYINGKLVDKDMFCNAVKSYHANHCFITGNVRSYCGLEHSLGELSLKAGSKFLQKVVREESASHNFDRKSQPSGCKSLLTPKKLTAMAVPGIFVLCCSFLCPCFHKRRKETGHDVLSKNPSSMGSVSSVEVNSAFEKIQGSPLRLPPTPRFSMSPDLKRVGSVHLNMSQVAKATKNFSPTMKIGEGGFGTVYKAQLQDGQIVAIKRARKELFEALRTEFSSEVELLTRIDHRNLVKLLGYVDKGNERLIITEYMPNGTLRDHLDGLRGKVLDFNQRLEISIDIAHALTYLHLYAEKQIIHRDVKSSNILLTESMRAKVADFGFARLGAMDSDKSHVSTKVKGTIGYLDPEYMRTRQLTAKSDVYSFGILLLEILTGRRPVELTTPANERVTLRWAFKQYNEGNVTGMKDPLMQEVVDEQILMKMFDLAIQCAAPTRTDRPDMKSVGEQLWGIRMGYLKTGSRGN
ncbi:calmodulin-binding receptor-like cytoplasmic kinase 3 isoform X2 [Cornus florida]|nr:calmodulin-binding receptor-like cytoplasmic kinase 3 isoform X2 [Cornus florida]